MRIQSLSLKNVRGFPSVELDFRDAVTGQVRMRTAIAGSNGSGKTTMFEAIFELLSRIEAITNPLFSFDNSFAQLLIQNLPQNSTRLLMITVDPQSRMTNIAYVNNTDMATAIQQQPLRLNWHEQVHIYGDAGDIFQQLLSAKISKIDFPNCLYFPSEGRQLYPKKSGQIIAEPEAHEWVYRFSDTDQWSGSLESFLVATYQRDLQTWYDKFQRDQNRSNGTNLEGDFQRLVKLINNFLQNKKIVGVDRHFRLQVEAYDGRSLGIDNLSSGEKQIILFLGEIQRRIRHGSILLIDEPEIHMHPRWQRLLVRVLTDLCTEYDAQLIITTQSQEIADAFYEHELILLDDIFKQNASKTNPSSLPEQTPEMTL